MGEYERNRTKMERDNLFDDDVDDVKKERQAVADVDKGWAADKGWAPVKRTFNRNAVQLDVAQRDIKAFEPEAATDLRQYSSSRILQKKRTEVLIGWTTNRLNLKRKLIASRRNSTAAAKRPNLSNFLKITIL